MPNQKKVTPFKQQIMQLICLFLEQNGQAFIAQQLEEKFILPQWLSKNNPLFKKGLSKIVKEYIRENKKINEYYLNRKNDQEQDQNQNDAEDDSDEDVQKKKSKSKDKKNKRRSQSKQKQIQKETPVLKAKSNLNSNHNHKPSTNSSWMNGFEQPKLLQDIQHNDETVERSTKITVIKHGEQKKLKQVQKQKQSKKKQRKNSKSIQQKRKAKKKHAQSQQQQQSQEQQQQSSQQEEQVKKPVKKLKVQIKEQKKIRKASKQIKETKKKVADVKQKMEVQQQKEINHIETRQQSNNIYPEKKNSNHTTYGQNQAFQRVRRQQVLPVPIQRMDNTFQAKFKYGAGGDQWGKFGYQKLKDTRGDSFKKTKGKLKNNAFQAAGIDINKVNSFKIL